jgi:hypothetical protein
MCSGPAAIFQHDALFGVLAGRHALRSRIVPDTHAHDDEPKQLALSLPRNEHVLAAAHVHHRGHHRRENRKLFTPS